MGKMKEVHRITGRQAVMISNNLDRLLSHLIISPEDRKVIAEFSSALLSRSTIKVDD